MRLVLLRASFPQPLLTSALHCISLLSSLAVFFSLTPLVGLDRPPLSTLISFGLFSLGGVRAGSMWPSPSLTSGQPLPQAHLHPQPHSHSQSPSAAQLQPHRIRASLKEERLAQQVRELSEELQQIRSELAAEQFLTSPPHRSPRACTGPSL